MSNDPLGHQHECLPDVAEILRDPAASFWLKDALRSALARDPVDAANDADLLARLLDARCQTILNSHQHKT